MNDLPEITPVSNRWNGRPAEQSPFEWAAEFMSRAHKNEPWYVLLTTHPSISSHANGNDNINGMNGLFEIPRGASREQKLALLSAVRDMAAIAWGRPVGICEVVDGSIVVREEP
jgi:hypothetical protein